MANSILFASIALVSAAASAVSAPAFAQDAPQAFVHYDDIDLASSDGAQRLQARVDRAVTKVCATGGHDLASVMAENKCRKTASAGASPQVALALAGAHDVQVAQNGRVSVAAH